MLEQFKFLVSNNPVYMIFHVTQNCNFSCSHCFNHEENKRANNDLSLSEIEKITLNMSHVKYLTLAGGEPFLRDDLVEIAELFYKNNDLHVLNVVTNGWHTQRAIDFAKKIFKRCPNLHVSIGVSIDGPQEIHDKIRNHNGSFKRAVETMEELKKLHLNGDKDNRLTIAACGTYNKMNAEYLADLAEYFQKKLNIPYFAGLIRGDSVPENDLKDIDIEHYMEVLRKINYSENTDLAKNYPFKHVRIAVDRIVSEIIYKSKKEGKKTINCKAGKKGFVLAADGEILLCEVLNKKLGNVRDNNYSPYEILKSKNSLNEIEKLRKNNCHCTWECFQRLNVVFSPVMYCDVALYSLKNFIGK